ncbi:O-antigen export system, permease protein [Methylomonas albis]|uniref:Transport permease protein n=1 Tax=Methylomonas albis TaxID=1854563 RepID=A0ABR9CY40_9GAMM|nr:ABC transporter permease [Methylomonas albis]MBD9355768.1 ABC transporter permease [Methylomonas albis]CAD6878789.1 O-antigen export system, permease protein [Methylomonas albis]
MIGIVKNVYIYRELIGALTWKNIVIRYKQAYLGILWAVLKPIMLMLVFTLVKSFVGIETGDLPYPLITFAALIPWVFFQESVSEGVNSVTSNAALIKKIYFPREVFPLTAMVTKTVELLISFVILAAMMAYYQIVPSVYALWIPAFILYTMIVALTISFFGAAMNVYYRDVGQAIPIALSLLMYGSPVIYPLSLVQKKLLEEQAAGEWSDKLYTLYTLNPLVGIIDGFQNVLLKASEPDLHALYPGLILTLMILPFSYWFFKRAESWFADVI